MIYCDTEISRYTFPRSAAGSLVLLLICIEISAGCSQEESPIYRSESAIVQDGNIHGLPPKLLALTFDDGPNQYTAGLAEYLNQQKIHATFFVVGDLGDGNTGVVNHPSALSSLVQLGQRIANHTYAHSHLPCPNTGVLNEVSSVQNMIDPYIHNELFMIRAPWGEWQPSSYVDCAPVEEQQNPAALIRQSPSLDKLTGQIFWDFDTHDYQCPGSGLTVEQCAYQALYGTDTPFVNNTPILNGANQGGIVLEHNQGTEDNYDLHVLQNLVPTLKALGYVFVAPVLNFSNLNRRCADFSDAQGWYGRNSYYGSIRLADVDHDGKADLCGRGSGGVVCALARSDGSGFFFNATLWESYFSDTNGWYLPQYGTTIQFGDIDGDGFADVCGRGSGGIVCEINNQSGGFGAPALWSSAFSDATAWGNNVGYYGTIRLADVNGDGKADICGRGADAVACGLSNGTSFSTPTPWSFSMTDSLGWLPVKYSTTIQFGDLDGDGKADICGRGADVVACALSQYPSSNSFGSLTAWSSEFSDAQGWGNRDSYYDSIRLGDVNGDGRSDICGRGAVGVVCGFSTFSTEGQRYFTQLTTVQTGFSDTLSWNYSYYGATMMMGDINGDGLIDLCGRGNDGIDCALAP